MSKVIKWASSLFIFFWFIITLKPGFIYAMKNIFLELHQYGEASSTRPSGMVTFQDMLWYCVFLSYQPTKFTLINLIILGFLHCQIMELHAIVKLAIVTFFGKLSIICMLAFQRFLKLYIRKSYWLTGFLSINIQPFQGY